MTAPILYVTFDGVLQPLGFSQVVRTVTELARKGFNYTVLSVERSGDMARGDHVARVEAGLRAVGVPWVRVETDSATLSSRRSGAAFARIAQAAFRVALTQRTPLVHARSYQGAAIAQALRSTLGTPYVLDARGCWIDERSGPGDWFFRAGPYAVGKFIEQKLFHTAAAIVTLTELQATDIRAGFAGDAPPLEVIPTCADYEAFALNESRPDKPSSSAAVPRGVQQELSNKVVVGIIGSINRFYRTEESLCIARLAVLASARVHLLILSKQREEYQALLRRLSFPMDRVSIADCTHDEMPEWLPWIDWGLLLLEDTAAKRGSLPTKLAEFFASGVRVVAYGCNSEMTSWVRRAGSGHVLDTLGEQSLVEAAGVIANSRPEIPMLRRARETTEPHFGLRQGVDRYADLLKRLL